MATPRLTQATGLWRASKKNNLGPFRETFDLPLIYTRLASDGWIRTNGPKLITEINASKLTKARLTKEDRQIRDDPGNLRALTAELPPHCGAGWICTNDLASPRR